MEQNGISRENLPPSPVGLFYAWWRGDALPNLPEPAELMIELDPAADEVRRINGLSDSQIAERVERGNRAVLGRIRGEAAAIGWSCAGQVEIGELGLDFELPSNNRYVWDFVTLPEWRGRGIYPALLRAFIEHEADVERFWVGHDLDNVASSRGILKAGFQPVGEVYAVEGAGPIFVAEGSAAARAAEAAELLGIPLLREAV